MIKDYRFLNIRVVIFSDKLLFISKIVVRKNTIK